jgi:thymidine kinase
MTAVACGRLELILGPMFSGKTTEIIRRAHAHQSEGRNVTAIRYTGDTRYSRNSIVSHNNISFPAISVEKDGLFKLAQESKFIADTDVILIDECHFFEELETTIDHLVDVMGKHVVVAGLNGSYLQQNFGEQHKLVCKTDDILHLLAKCKKCDGPANFTKRTVQDSNIVLIGGSDKYEPRCRICLNI